MNLKLLKEGVANTHHLNRRGLDEARSISRQLRELIGAKGESSQGLAGYILTLSDREDNARVIRIPYEKQTLASMLGIKPETLSRSFRRLSEHGVVVNGPVVEVRDRAALEAFLGEA